MLIVYIHNYLLLVLKLLELFDLLLNNYFIIDLFDFTFWGGSKGCAPRGPFAERQLLKPLASGPSQPAARHTPQHAG